MILTREVMRLIKDSVLIDGYDSHRGVSSVYKFISILTKFSCVIWCIVLVMFGTGPRVKERGCPTGYWPQIFA